MNGQATDASRSEEIEVVSYEIGMELTTLLRDRAKMRLRPMAGYSPEMRMQAILRAALIPAATTVLWTIHKTHGDTKESARHAAEALRYLIESNSDSIAKATGG